MKKFVILMSIAITLLYGCSNNQIDDVFESPSVSEGNVTSRSSSDTTSMNWQFIDFVEDESYESQTAVIMIAAERLDKYVSFTGERYIMASCTPEEVRLSQRVFEYMQGLMDQKNKTIDNLEGYSLVDGKKFVYSEIEYSTSRIQTRTEGGQPGGISGYKTTDTWYGYSVDIYISHQDLVDATYYSALTTFLLNKYALASRIVTAVSIACELASLTCSYLASTYPNGIIITIEVVTVFGCIPHSLTGQ